MFFTYALSPLTDKLTSVDWKLLVTKDIGRPHIRCHELQAGDNLLQLIAGFQKAHAVAVVLINSSDDYSLHPTFLSGTQEGNCPVLLLTKGDGMKLLNTVEQYEKNLLARIRVDHFSVPVGTLQETGDGLAHINSDQTDPKKPGQCVMYSVLPCMEPTKVGSGTDNGILPINPLDIVGVSMSKCRYSSYQL